MDKRIEDEHPVEAYIALGSNIEPRGKYIERAVNALSDNKAIDVLEISSVFETVPEGGPIQGDFLNAVVKISTTLTPLELLDAVQAIETSLGRKREVHWGPRTIDLDILLYGQEIISDERLSIPHPLMHERKFVMLPLAQISPQLNHPILMMSAKTILESLG